MCANFLVPFLFLNSSVKSTRNPTDEENPISTIFQTTFFLFSRVVVGPFSFIWHQQQQQQKPQEERKDELPFFPPLFLVSFPLLRNLQPTNTNQSINIGLN